MPHTSGKITVLGPLIVAKVGVSDPTALALEKSGKIVPKPIEVTALVDTGADASVIDASLVGPLQLEATGYHPVLSATTGDTPEFVLAYQVSIGLTHPILHWNLFDASVTVGNFENMGFRLLLGRDVLEFCLLVYDGPNKTFTIGF